MTLDGNKNRLKLNSTSKLIQRSIMAVSYNKFKDLKDYYHEIKRKFERDEKDLAKRYYERIDENEFNDYFIEENVRIEDIFLKQFRYSIVVMIYSLLESRLNHFCHYLSKSKKLRLELDDIKGDGIERAKLYLSKVCLIDFPEQGHEWNEMIKLNIIRNCVVHAEGIVHKAKNQKKLKGVINNTCGLEVENKYLKIENSYIDSALLDAENLINKVYEKVISKI